MFRDYLSLYYIHNLYNSLCNNYLFFNDDIQYSNEIYVDDKKTYLITLHCWNCFTKYRKLLENPKIKTYVSGYFANYLFLYYSDLLNKYNNYLYIPDYDSLTLSKNIYQLVISSLTIWLPEVQYCYKQKMYGKCKYCSIFRSDLSNDIIIDKLNKLVRFLFDKNIHHKNIKLPQYSVDIDFLYLLNQYYIDNKKVIDKLDINFYYYIYPLFLSKVQDLEILERSILISSIESFNYSDLQFINRYYDVIDIVNNYKSVINKCKQIITGLIFNIRHIHDINLYQQEYVNNMNFFIAQLKNYMNKIIFCIFSKVLYLYKVDSNIISQKDTFGSEIYNIYYYENNLSGLIDYVKQKLHL